MELKNIIEKIENSEDTLREIAALNVKDAVGYRGFISSKPDLTLETMMAGTARGFMYWGQRVYIAKDLDQAMEHHNYLTVKDGRTNILMAAFYLISDLSNEDLYQISKFSEKEITKIFINECSRGVYHCYNDTWIQIPATFLKNCFVNVDLMIISEDEGHFFYQMGWFAPEIRGVTKFSKLEGSKTIKKARYISRKLYRKGYYITFNQNLKAVMQGCIHQSRKGQTEGVGSRITNELMENYMELLKLGKAYSVELRDKEGEIISGIFGFISGGEIVCDSIFYPAIQKEDLENEVFKSNIDYAKVAVLAVFDRARAAGLEFIDLGMVTEFTQSNFKAEYISRDEFFSVLENLPENVKIDFESEWNPIP